MNDPTPPASLLDVLAGQHPGRSRSDLRKLLADGRVRVNGSTVRIAKVPIGPADIVTVVQGVPAPARSPLPFAVVFADADLLVIDKPAGLLTSSVPRERRPTALALARGWAAEHRPRARVGLVHRLDADASGLLVFSLNNTAHARLKDQFFDRTAGRTYAAVVTGTVRLDEGTIRSRLVEYADGTVHTTRSAAHGQAAVTHYRVDTAAADRTLLRVRLDTGRKHQIRAHLSGQGWPIVGDRLYGGVAHERLLLHARDLVLTHPADGQRREFTSPPPTAFRVPTFGER